MKDYPKITGLPCVCCGFVVKSLYPDDRGLVPESMYDDGNLAEINAGFGSTLDGDIWLIAICDECMRIKGLKIGQYM